MRHKRKPPQDVRRRRPILLSPTLTRSSPRENGQGDRSGERARRGNSAESGFLASKGLAVALFCFSLLGTVVCLCLLPRYLAADVNTGANSIKHDFGRVHHENIGPDGDDFPPVTTKLFQGRWEKRQVPKGRSNPLTVSAKRKGDGGDIGGDSYDQLSAPKEVPLSGGWRHSVGALDKSDEPSYCDFDVRYADDLTEAEFAETYHNKGPLLLKFSGGAQDWTDTETWTREDLVGKYGDHMVEFGYEEIINTNGGRGANTIPLKDYVHFHMDVVNTSAMDTAYVADSSLLKSGDLRDKIHPPKYLQSFQQPTGVLLLGRSGLGLSWHEHGDAWNGVVYGEKLWYVYNRSTVPPGLHRYETAEWLDYVYRRLPVNKSPLECTQEAGDIVYIPQGFYHSVLNVGETIAVSFRESQVTPLPGRDDFVQAISRLESEEDIRKGTEALRVNNIHYHRNPLPDYAVGVLHMRTGNYEAAVRGFKAALTVDRFYIPGYVSITDALSKLGRVDEAEAYFLKGLDIHGTSVMLLEEYGEFRQAQGDLVTALEAYKTASELRPGRKDLYQKVLELQTDLAKSLE